MRIHKIFLNIVPICVANHTLGLGIEKRNKEDVKSTHMYGREREQI